MGQWLDRPLPAVRVPCPFRTADQLRAEMQEQARVAQASVTCDAILKAQARLIEQFAQMERTGACADVEQLLLDQNWHLNIRKADLCADQRE